MASYISHLHDGFCFVITLKARYQMYNEYIGFITAIVQRISYLYQPIYHHNPWYQCRDKGMYIFYHVIFHIATPFRTMPPRCYKTLLDIWVFIGPYTMPFWVLCIGSQWTINQARKWPSLLWMMIAHSNTICYISETRCQRSDSDVHWYNMSLRCLAPWINHLYLVCWSNFGNLF